MENRATLRRDQARSNPLAIHSVNETVRAENTLTTTFRNKEDGPSVAIPLPKITLARLPNSGQNKNNYPQVPKRPVKIAAMLLLTSRSTGKGHQCLQNKRWLKLRTLWVEVHPVVPFILIRLATGFQGPSPASKRLKPESSPL